LIYDGFFFLFSARGARYSPLQSSQDSRQASEGVAIQIETETDEEKNKTYLGNQAGCCHGTTRKIGK